ncbi:hypothetical protein BK133_03050 [Paenibacillus sp. FSL H8-0548]|nr:hypothetical protein BK133_03050 [Paenibacillus sp. FSL H8-0548]
MLRRIWPSNRSIIVNWLISYVAVLFVPIVISGVIYVSTMDIVKNEINRANESTLVQMEQAIDSKLRGIERISVEISLNKSIADFTHAERELTDSDHYELFLIANSLRVYKLANEFIEQIYIRYENSDTVISPQERIDSETLFALLKQREDMSATEWQNIFNSRYIQSYTPVQYESDDKKLNSVLFARSIALHNPGQPSDLILIIINDAKLLENFTPAEGSSVVILDENNRIIASSASSGLTANLRYDLLNADRGVLYNNEGNNELAVSYTTSSVTGWKYITLTPAKVFNQKMEDMKRLIYLSVFLCLVVGGVVSYVFMRMNYNPISLLISRFSNKAGVAFDGSSNEYLFLEETINSAFNEKEEISKRLKRHNDVVRSHFLSGLLKGRVETSVPLHDSLSAHAIDFSSPLYAVILFYIEDYGKYGSDEGTLEGSSKKRLLHFFITNVVEETSRENNDAYMVDMDDSLACIINFRGDNEELNRSELLRIADCVKSFLLRHLQVHLTIAVSDIQREIFGIANAYQEAMEALEYSIVLGNGETIPYAALKQSEHDSTMSGYYYPLTIEQQLINFMKTGDFEKSEQLVEMIFNKNFGHTPLSAPLAKCLMFDLISTMMKTIEDMNAISKSIFLDQSNPVDKLMNCRTIKEMKQQLMDVLQQVCAMIESGRKQENQLISQVVEFVKAEYSNEGLNISMIGDRFELTPSYLSRQFRDATGETLLDFINKTRLMDAKQMLLSNKCPVNEISRAVGYGDINTFNRIFKKFEGVTPGKYREMNEAAPVR